MPREAGHVPYRGAREHLYLLTPRRVKAAALLDELAGRL